MGSQERLEIQTEINNRGEGAFNAVLEVQIPPGVSYVNTNTGDSGVIIQCTSPGPRNNNTLTCEVGNPLRAGAKVNTALHSISYRDNINSNLSLFFF